MILPHPQTSSSPLGLRIFWKPGRERKKGKGCKWDPGSFPPSQEYISVLKIPQDTGWKTDPSLSLELRTGAEGGRHTPTKPQQQSPEPLLCPPLPSPALLLPCYSDFHPTPTPD